MSHEHAAENCEDCDLWKTKPSACILSGCIAIRKSRGKCPVFPDQDHEQSDAVEVCTLLHSIV